MPAVGWVSKRVASPFVAFCIAAQMLLALVACWPEIGTSLAAANSKAGQAMTAGAADAGHPCHPPENQCHASPHCNPTLPAVPQNIAVVQDREPAVTYHGSFAQFTAPPASPPPLVASA